MTESSEASRPTVLAMSGSPSPTSKTARVADHVLAMIAAEGISVEHVRLSSLDPTALLRAKWDDPDIVTLTAKLDAAHGVVIATPIFKASCSGLLKAGLDVLPQFGLAGKVVLPIGTGGSIAHVLALDYGLRPILQSMGARHVVQSHFVSEQDIEVSGELMRLSDAAQAPLAHAVRNFLHSLTALDEARWLGHPRPPQADPAAG